VRPLGVDNSKVVEIMEAVDLSVETSVVITSDKVIEDISVVAAVEELSADEKDKAGVIVKEFVSEVKSASEVKKFIVAVSLAAVVSAIVLKMIGDTVGFVLKPSDEVDVLGFSVEMRSVAK